MEREINVATGDIKIFIDLFNSELDKVIQRLNKDKVGLKDAYAKAIAITDIRKGTWPKDDSIKTIGDLFKYTFPDIETSSFIKPPDYIENNVINETKEKDYKSWESDFKSNGAIYELFTIIFSGVNFSKKLENYNKIKKPGVTNPNLYSPGQYYFDVFMDKILSAAGPLKTNNIFNSVSKFSKDGNSNDRTNIADYYVFWSMILKITSAVELETGMDIKLYYDLSEPLIEYSSLFTQYKSGLLSELSKDAYFNKDRGSSDGYNFSGNYEHIYLYKAFIQAGDNYKSVVLPLEKDIPDVKTITLPSKDNNEVVKYTFNVEKYETFIIKGVSASNDENDVYLYIVPEYDLVESSYSMEGLSSEYIESEFVGEEEEYIKFEPAQEFAFVNTDALNSAKGYDPMNPDDSLSTDTESKYPISKNADANIRAIIKVAKELGVTNKFAIIGMLAVVGKESGFIPQSEASYKKTGADRIRLIFGGYASIKSRTNAEIDKLKVNDKAFFDAVYDGINGNGANDGYKYRGRGFNQITFKGGYKHYYEKLGIDVINDPDLLNTVEVAAKCLVEYMKINLKGLSPSDVGKTKIREIYNFNGDMNSFTSLDDAVAAIFHANAGVGQSYNKYILPDKWGGRKKSFAAAGPLYKKYASLI